MRLVSLLLLAACAGTPEASLPAEQLAVPPDLDLVIDGDLTAGDRFTVQVTGAAAADPVYVMVSDGPMGTGACPPFLGGLCMGMRAGSTGYLVMAQGTANGSGSYTRQLTLPRTVSPGVFHVQAIGRGPVSAISQVERVAVSDGVCTTDAYEPNDTLGAATDAVGAVALPGAYLCDGEDDWYTLEIPAGAYVEATITYPTTEGDLDVELFDTAGNVLDGGYRDTGTEVVAWYNSGTSAVTANLWVYRFFDADADGISYDIAVETITPGVCTDDAGEPDDMAAEARELFDGDVVSAVSCPADADWYEVALTAGDTLLVEVDEVVVAGDVELQLRDAAGVALAPQADRVDYLATADGSVFLEATLVNDDASQPGNGYALDVEIIRRVACTDDAHEPDDTVADAVVVTPGFYDGFTACLGTNPDWFEVAARRGDTIDLVLTADSADGDADIYLYDPLGNVVAAAQQTGSVETITYTTLLHGPYRVLVNLYADTGGETIGGVPYSLEVGLTP